jgi:hypothetical protein
MRILLGLLACLVLCSCAAPEVQTRYSGSFYMSGPTSINDPRMHSPQFYMDDADGLPAWTRAVPASNQ